MTERQYQNSKYNNESYINKAKEIHGDKYDYSSTNYINIKTKIIIICKIHGEIIIRPDCHLVSGCTKCSSTNSKLNTEIFINRAREIHRDVYDYSLTNYINIRTKVTIVCHKHGQFLQLPQSHLKGNGCNKCSKESVYKTTDQFIQEAISMHGDIYNYSLVNYTHCLSPVDIICKKHGVFKQKPNIHLTPCGCPLCRNDTIISKYTKPHENFIIECVAVHGDTYDYTNTKYINSKTKIVVKCKKHGDFSIRPGHHTSGIGCYRCKPSSKGEIIIASLLDGVYEFHTQHKFIDCISPMSNRKLKFDFYIPSLNTVIEYNGEQHYYPNDFFGGIEKFKTAQIRDNHKIQYCNDKCINMVIIKYDEDIKQKLIEHKILENEHD